MGLARRIVGITGGIATGKTTVAQCLVECGIPVADADILAKEAVRPGTNILRQIRDRYGDGILDDLGQLNREQLAQLVFQNPAERRWLEAKIHPFVRLQLELFISQLPEDATAAIVVPLLFEAEMTDLVTEIWTVICSPQQQLERLKQRNQLSEVDAKVRIESQWPLTEKALRSHVVIDNRGTLPDTYQQTLQALESTPPAKPLHHDSCLSSLDFAKTQPASE